MISDRSELLSMFQNAENNFAVVHVAMRLYYEGAYSLEEALMVAVINLTMQNDAMMKAAALNPPPIFIMTLPPSK